MASLPNSFSGYIIAGLNSRTPVSIMGCPDPPAEGATTVSLTFYYAPMSTASITQLVLEELGVPCEKVKLDIQKGDTKKPEFLKISPNGKVPVVVHDGVVIWESSAITMYLGEAFGVEKKLYPAAGPKRGEAMSWIAWTNVTLGDAVARFTRNTMSWIPAEQHNAKAAEVAKEDIQHCLRILDESLESKQFLIGDYTLVDTHLNSFVAWLRHMKMDLGAYARLNAWSQRCAARPAYAKVMAG
jgi:glutathione S-transferase